MHFSAANLNSAPCLAGIFNSVLRYDRTTLNRRRIDVMVDSPSKNHGIFADLLRAVIGKAWCLLIQHEQSSTQHLLIESENANIETH